METTSRLHADTLTATTTTENLLRLRLTDGGSEFVRPVSDFGKNGMHKYCNKQPRAEVFFIFTSLVPMRAVIWGTHTC